MGDAAPDTTDETVDLIVQYLLPDGCVHIYGDKGVDFSAVVRRDSLLLGPDGQHIFPEWF